MSNLKIRSIWENSYQDFPASPGNWGSTFPSARTAGTLNSTTIPVGTVTARTVRR